MTTPAPEFTPEQFEAALAAYLEALTTATAEHHSRWHPNVTPPVFKTETGPKYIRVISESTFGASRSAHGFVERATGLLWKAASWKGPARNFPRGSLFKPEEWNLNGSIR